MSTVMIWQTVSTSSADTERLGELLGQKLKGGEVLELRSDLGGGKTTFVKGLARGLGAKSNVSSPTFTLSRIYQAGDLEIHHYDFYRLNEAGIMADEIAESVANPKVVTIVEWADIVESVLPKDHLSLELKPTANDPDERQLIFSYPESMAKTIEQIRAAAQETRP